MSELGCPHTVTLCTRTERYYVRWELKAGTARNLPKFRAVDELS